MRPAQLTLFAPAAAPEEFVRGVRLDRTGMSRYVHVMVR